MFFTRFEGDEIDGADNNTVDQLAAFKNRIAEKQKLKLESHKKHKGTDQDSVPSNHPTKKRKISTTSGNLGKDNVSSDTVNEIQSSKINSSEKKKKKKPRKLVTTSEPQTENGTIDLNSETGKKEKKKKRKKNSAHEEVDPVEVDVIHESALRKGSDDQSLSEPIPVNHSSSCVPSERPKNESDKVQQKSEQKEEVESSQQEPDVTKQEGKEDWVVLGKHKKTEKVGRVKRQLPDWIAHAEVIDPDFDNGVSLSESLFLDDCVKQALQKISINSLFPIQSQIIPEILAGCQGITMLTRHLTPPPDLCVSAPTGSGKTLLYVLPLVQCLHKLPPRLQAVIVVPTKNLANQVKSVLNNFDKLLKVALLSGKDSFAAEQKHLYTESGCCLAHVAVTTPGRLVNHIRETKPFTLQHLRFLVIDEMDTLLNQTYQDWLPLLYQAVYNTDPYQPPSQPQYRTLRYKPCSALSLADLLKPALPLQKLLFSATVTHDPSKLAPLQLYTPRLYSCGGKYTMPSSLLQYQIRCKLEDKALLVIHLVREVGRVLCFTSSVDTAHRLALLVEEYGGLSVAEYSSTLTANQRNRVVRDFSKGDIQLLVCSDSLARGMDLQDVNHVVNYDVPAHVQTYVHRAGRTARAGREGHVYTLLRHEEMRHFGQLLRKAGNTRATDKTVSDETLATLAEDYESCLQRLEARLKSKNKK